MFKGRRRAQETDLGKRLRAERPQASADLVASIVARVGPRPVSRGRVRVGIALATTGVLVVAFAALGGVGYASSAARDVVRKFETVVHSKSTSHQATPLSPARAQYGPVPVPPYPPPKQNPNPPPAPTPPPPPGGSGSGSGPGNGGVAGGSHGQKGPSGGVAGGSHGQTKGGGLPFTGLSLLFPAALAIGLIGAGIALRRRGRQPSE